jgi:thiosulfate reductase cytochrome b subunit
MQLASYTPGGILPEFLKGTNVVTDGEFYIEDDGALFFQPSLNDQELYIFGKDNISWVDWYGLIALLGVLGVIVVHSGLRVLAAKKAPAKTIKTKKVYMYSFYERLWHWLQTISILLLAFTGFIIHKPDLLAVFSFKGAVFVHNIVAGILAANAVLALFYNLVSGDIKRFIPEPKGFFNQTFAQLKYYASGIFKGEDHPIEKTRNKRLNVLQKFTYFGILNVLLPLQGLTGILMWGAKQFPEIVNRLGGLPFLAPFHTFVAWTFVSFIIGHVYLTTTGVKPLSAISAMVVGFEDIEEHSNDGIEEKNE